MSPTSLRRSRPRLATTVTASAVVAAMGLAGCGVSGGTTATATSAGPAPAKVEAGSFSRIGGAKFLRDAAASTAEVTSERLSYAVDAKGGSAGVSVNATGEVDNAAKQAHLTVGLEGVGSLAGDTELVVDGTDVYVKSELVSRLGGQDKPWLKVDGSKLGSGASSFGLGERDPGSLLNFLKGAGGPVTTVGKEDVRGVSTTHVKVDLDLAKLLTDAPSAERKKLEDQLDGLGSAGAALKTIPAEAWVDDDGYVRKLVLSFDGAKAGADGVSAKVTIEMYDFNQPVEIKVPDPAEVGTLDTSLLGGD